MSALAADDGGLVSTFHCGLANRAVNRELDSIFPLFVNRLTRFIVRKIAPILAEIKPQAVDN